MNIIIMLIRNLIALFLFFIGLGFLSASDEQGSLGLKIFMFLIVFYPALLLFTKTSHFAKLIYKSPKEALGVLKNLPKEALGVLKNLSSMIISKEEISEIKEGFSEMKEGLKELKEDNEEDKLKNNKNETEESSFDRIVRYASYFGFVFFGLMILLFDFFEIWRNAGDIFQRKEWYEMWMGQKNSVWLFFILCIGYILYLWGNEEQENSQEKENKSEDNRPRIDKNGADEIEKLSKLREKGILTDEEFETKKKELLDRI